MDEAKLRPDLSTRLARADANDVLDVVVELNPQAEPAGAAELSRSEQIALRKEAFAHDVAPVEEAISESGGEVLGRAWINQTVHARVPARRVKKLSELDKVAALGVPRTLDAEVG